MKILIDCIDHIRDLTEMMDRRHSEDSKSIPNQNLHDTN